MTFKTYNESFDKPYKFEVYNKSALDRQYNFETNNDMYYITSMLKTKSKNQKFTLIAFETAHGEMNMTGTGDAFRVLASVIQAAKNESKKFKDADYVEFAAAGSEPSRQKLYTRFTKILKKMHNFKYTREYKRNNDIHYFLSRTKIIDSVIKSDYTAL